jgi:hypothetical protein
MSKEEGFTTESTEKNDPSPPLGAERLGEVGDSRCGI